MKAIVSLFLGALVAFAQPAPASAQIHEVPAKGQKQINAHGTCRVVVNAGSTDLMVGTNTAQEWANGTNSFLINIGDIPNVTARTCVTTLKPIPSSMRKCSLEFIDPYEINLTGNMWNTITDKTTNNGRDLNFRTYARSCSLTGDLSAWNAYVGQTLTLDQYIAFAYNDDGSINDAYHYDWSAPAGVITGTEGVAPTCVGRGPGVYLWRDKIGHGWNPTTRFYHGVVHVYPFVCQ